MNMLLFALRYFAPEDGGGAAAPVPAQVSSPSGDGAASAASGASSASETDWASVLDGVPAAADPPSGAPGQGGEPPAALVAPPAAPVAQAPVEQPAAPPEPAPAPQSQEPAQPIPDVLDPAWRGERLKDLAQGYTFSAEQANAFHEDPVAALPQLAAQVELNVLTRAATLMDYYARNAFPLMIAEHSQRTTQEATARAGMEAHVYPQFPKLREVAPQTLTFVAQQIARSMPAAKGPERVKAFGAAVYALHGWQLPSAAPAAAPQVAPPQPYMPAMPGGGGAPMPVTGGGESDMWASLLDK